MIPKNTSQDERCIKGKFKSEVFRSDDDRFCVGRLANNTTIVGSWSAGDLINGMPYRFFGQFKKHPKFGQQFVIEGFIEDVPLSRYSARKYLESIASSVDGIGPASVSKIVNAFPDVEQLMEMISVNDADGIMKQTGPLSARLEDGTRKLISLAHERSTSQIALALVYGVIAGFGFTGQTAQEAVDRIGHNASIAIRNNPFILMDRNIRGAGFLRCDALYKSLGHPLAGPARIRAACRYVITSNGDGSTWYTLSWLKGEVEKMVDGNVDIERCVSECVNSGHLAIYKGKQGISYVTDSKWNMEEQLLAENLLKLM